MASQCQREHRFYKISALDGVYGTITLTPLTGPFDARASLADEFAEQEGSSAKSIGEGTTFAGGGKSPIKVYTRTYETAALETLHYRIQFTVGTIGNWAVRVWHPNTPRRATTTNSAISSTPRLPRRSAIFQDRRSPILPPGSCAGHARGGHRPRFAAAGRFAQAALESATAIAYPGRS